MDAQVTYNGVKQPAATVTLTDTKCPETGTKVKRTLTTNANGHVALTTTSTAEAIGLPWSTYKVCASKKVTNSKGKIEYRKFEIPTLAIETLEGPVTPSLDLSGTSSTGSSESSYHC